MDTGIPEWVQSQAASDAAQRLTKLTNLKSVHVVPAEFIDRALWSASPDPPFESPDTFGPSLGRLAAPFVARELANAIHLNAVNTENFSRINKPQFKLAVAGGSTIHGLIQAIEIPRGLPDGKCVITPLVVGPIPETIYSAGFIAEMLESKLQSSEVARISETSPGAKGGFSISMKPEIEAARNELDVTKPDQLSNNAKKLLAFNWVITGVGSNDSGQLKAHLSLMYRKSGLEIPSNIVGDICSRLFGVDGGEKDEVTGNKFVGVSFKWLTLLTRLKGFRVVAIAGGRGKLTALRALLERSKKDPKAGLFNVLITDELTARMLLRVIGDE